MWIFTPIGFYSAVLKEDDPAVMMVRGRVRKDMERLQDLTRSLQIEPGEILEWEHRDYPYRLLILRTEWSDVLYAFGRKINYTNYKNEVKKQDGPKRAAVYGRIWGIMLDAERTIQD